METEHFTFYGDDEPERIVGIATDLERVRQALVQIAPSGRFDSSVPIRFYLFAEPGDLAPFVPGGESAHQGSPGFLLPHEHGVYGASVRVESGTNAGRYVYKQYLHWVLQSHLPELPLWFRQGLAELYSNFEVTDSEARIGLPIEEHIRYLRGEVRIDAIDFARQVLYVSEPELRSDAAGDVPASSRITPAGQAPHHPETWAVVHYLVIGSEETRRKVPEYLRRVVVGEEPEAAFRAAFGKSSQELAGEIDEYVQAETWRFARYPLASLGPVAVETQMLSPAEVEYRLGDLLAHARPDAVSAADAYFQRALALAPDHALAAAGRGWLAQAEGRADDALAAYRRAVTGAPDEPLLQYLYGDALLAGLGRRRPASEEELATLRAAEGALTRASELDPGNPEPWARLGFALNLEPQGSERAVATLERAARLLPSRMDVANNLLLAYARSGDIEAADLLLASMPARGATQAELAQAREIRLQLAFAEANTLTHQERLDDAVAVLARIRAETRSPATAERAQAQLELIARTDEQLRFAVRFQAAAEAIESGDPAAGEALAALGELVRPGRQTECYEALLERLESRPSQAASSGEPKAAAAPR